MLFNSTLFLVFLAVVVAAYYHLAPRGRRIMLLVASYVFYGVWSVPFSGLLLLSTIIDWAAARIIDSTDRPARRRLGLAMTLIGNLGVLCLFKYADFFSDSAWGLLGVRPWPHLDLILPLGISFYPFQTMSYTIDVYRGDLKARRSLLDVALFVSFFPQLVAGPIVRAEQLLPELDAEHAFDWLNIRAGLSLVIWGLVKKVFFADAMAHLVNDAFSDPSAHSGVSLWLASYAFMVQIYCDFSGYSDIAIGSARMLGVRLPENFDKPYLSCSIREFWRRWHISLSTWLRDYLYIPLGGSRRGVVRTYANLMITMLIGGLWHGAGWTWVLWGGLQGAVMSVERAVGLSDQPPKSPLWRVVRWFVTLQIVCVSFVLFRAHTMEAAATVLTRMFTVADGYLHVGFRPAACMALLLLVELLDGRRRFLELLSMQPVAARWIGYVATALMVVTFSGVSNPEFIYFQF